MIDIGYSNLPWVTYVLQWLPLYLALVAFLYFFMPRDPDAHA